MDKTKMDKYRVRLIVRRRTSANCKKDEATELTMYRAPEAGVIYEGEYQLKIAKHALDNNNLHPAFSFKVEEEYSKPKCEVVLLSSQDHYERYGVIVNTDLITEDDETLSNIQEIVEKYDTFREAHLKVRVFLAIDGVERARKRL